MWGLIATTVPAPCWISECSGGEQTFLVSANERQLVVEGPVAADRSARRGERWHTQHGVQVGVAYAGVLDLHDRLAGLERLGVGHVDLPDDVSSAGPEPHALDLDRTASAERISASTLHRPGASKRWSHPLIAPASWTAQPCPRTCGRSRRCAVRTIGCNHGTHVCFLGNEVAIVELLGERLGARRARDEVR